MLTTLSSICDRFKRQRSIARRQRRRRLIAGRLEELHQLEVRLENLAIDDNRWLRDNMTMIKVFYAEIELAKRLFKQQQFGLAKKSRGAAKATLICIERNFAAARNDANIRYVIN
jgi:hypothetical protein